MKNEKGFTLIEVVIALLLLGIIASGFLMALSGATKAIIVADERTTAESLARSQMEYVKEQDYSISGSYDKIDLSSYPFYDIDVDATPLAGLLGGIQKITVNIYHPDTDPTPVIDLEGYKANR